MCVFLGIKVWRSLYGEGLFTLEEMTNHGVDLQRMTFCSEAKWKFCVISFEIFNWACCTNEVCIGKKDGRSSVRKYLYVRSITTLFCADTSPQFFHPNLSEEWLGWLK